ncbi:MAG: DUF805 domain-containing protein [Candidatus Thermoplasmatota archaeon]|nr:DUF805 domain-containing protein [Candidatus Thermoplasmatota archaeon]
MQPQQPGQQVIVGQPTQYTPGGGPVIVGQTNQFAPGVGQVVGVPMGMGMRPAQIMSFTDAVTSCFQKYFDFNGRASRSEYWFFYLSYVIAVFTAMLGSIMVMMVSESLWALSMIGYVGVILGFIAPMLAVTARRLHDVGYSGLWMLIAFVPFGSLVLLVFCLMEGEGHQNMYGPVPTNVLL